VEHYEANCTACRTKLLSLSQSIFINRKLKNPSS
jgi:hypothetical protein